MKTDRELLELAAKSVGLKVIRYLEGFGLAIEGEPVWWNPRDNDGQALRLAVLCNLTICTDGTGTVSACQEFDRKNVFATQSVQECGGCKLSATRRAIVRAAATIGESMQ